MVAERNGRRRRRSGLVVGRGWVSLVASATLVVVGCAEEPRPPEPTLRPVRTTVVEAPAGVREAVYSGVAEASVESRLSFRVPGTVVELPARVGARVGVGDLIARLDDADYRLEIERARAGLDQATANRTAAASTYERVQLLYENENASRNEYDTALAQREAAVAGVESAQTQLELARQRHSYTRLTSPLAGAVASVEVDANENVNAGQPIAVVSSETQPQVLVSISEVRIGQLATGGDVRVRFDAFPDRSYPARITEVGVASSGRATTFPVTVRLADAAAEIRPGMAAEVVFTIPSDPAFIVPAAAVVEDREGRFVFVVDAEGSGAATVRRQQVEVGQIRQSGLEVVAGLSPGDRVVTAGARRLVDGQQVRISDG